jgi:hypothetical protein
MPRKASRNALNDVCHLKSFSFWWCFIFKYLQKMSNKELTTQDFDNILNFYESNYKIFMTRCFSGQALPQLAQIISLMSETSTELKSLIERTKSCETKYQLYERFHQSFWHCDLLTMNLSRKNQPNYSHVRWIIAESCFIF